MRALTDAHTNARNPGGATPEQWWNLLSPEERQKYLDSTTYSDESEYGSVSQ
jgi:hypothetical protein